MNNVVELGRGVIDFPALHRILKSVSHKGWITIHLDNARISPRDSGRIQKEYIDRALAPIYSWHPLVATSADYKWTPPLSVAESIVQLF